MPCAFALKVFMTVDVLVIGGGNAALCAALMAREAGASVMLLESAPREWREERILARKSERGVR